MFEETVVPPTKSLRLSYTEWERKHISLEGLPEDSRRGTRHLVGT